ncbi:DUF3316 domain-containing protein [Vibrio sp. ZSDE26]|uniref:DUF3316 domain-containing protein n=1 Tax=Vibrio amylolyticus TaxID=2847292 RepID=A0A9X1XS23_9VIBR|nr:DUF3316 domain-containing protein [Vibrio amylolyticus]MCK6264534.1 DUF3316 domain-containing protein [Vibrio amylolyticus]
MMKNAILFTIAMMVSSTTFAGVNTRTSEASLKTGAYATPEQAYSAGYDLMDQFNEMPTNQLLKELPINENNVQYPSVKVTGSKVTVEEFSKKRGEIQYRAVVEVDYQYKYRESRNS